MPVSFPFDLEINDNLATVNASTAVDRRDYAIGAQSQPDESNVRFGVELRRPDAQGVCRLDGQYGMAK